MYLGPVAAKIWCDFIWKETIFSSYLFSFFPLFKDCVQLNQYKLKDEIGKVPSETTHWLLPFTDFSIFFSLPPTACLSSSAHHQGHAVTVSDILSLRLSSFPKLCVNYQAMGELEDGWEAGINSAL